MPYILVSQLAEKLPAYQPFHELLTQQQQRLSELASTRRINIASLARQLADASYQIGSEESILIAKDLLVEKDMNLGGGLRILLSTTIC